MKSKEYQDKVRSLLGKIVTVYIDRAYGTLHPKHKNIKYEQNYGYIKDFKAPDGDYQDVYVIGIYEPLDKFKGKVIAIIERTNDDEDKLIVCDQDKDYSNEEIEKLIYFQEQYFKHILIR